MIAVARVDLRGATTWDTALLTARTFEWPISAPGVPLSELVTMVSGGSLVGKGTQVITPASLDPQSGGVRRRSERYQGLALQVGRELQTGDVLVPGSPDAPAVLVTNRLRGATVSTGFTALRPTAEVTSLWVWAVLSSESGHQIRRHLSLGSLNAGGVKARVLDVCIPIPPLAHQFEIEAALRQIEASTHVEEEQAVTTWWRRADLRGQEWRLLLASPEPERLDEGDPLELLTEQIEQGGSRDEVSTDELVGAFYVTDIGVLNGRPPKRWATSLGSGGVLTSRGDVLVAAVGTRAHAMVAPESSVLDRNVIRIRLKDPQRAEALARYLNGPVGHGLRQMLLRGSTVPHLSVRDLARLPVSAEALRYDGADAPAIPLASQLERTLWRS